MRCTLFRHEGRILHPTEAAQALAEVAREVLQSMARGIRETRELAGYAADCIRIGSLYSLTSRTVPAIVIAMKQRQPELQIELVLGSNMDLLQKLRDNQIDAALMAILDDAPDIESELLFKDVVYFAAPANSRHATLSEVDLRDCARERFVSLSEGFVTYDGFLEAFRIAGFTPDVVMQTGDIFSLMNLVDGGIGCTLLPGRVRGALPLDVRLIPLQSPYLMSQAIGLNFMRTRERDPNLLTLLAVCRAAKAKLT